MRPREFYVCVAIVLWCSTLVRADDSTRHLLDMTFAFSDSSIYWPTDTAFKLKVVKHGKSQGGSWYASNEYGASEHGGTHVDAPIHFAEHGRTIDQIPMEEWIGPAVKIDVTRPCEKNRDYLLTVDDLKSWEKENGRIPDRSWVLMFTGIDTRFYPRRKEVLGTEVKGKEALPLLSFPGFSKESIEFLLKQRNITGIGLDTPSGSCRVI